MKLKRFKNKYKVTIEGIIKMLKKIDNIKYF